MSNKGTTHEKFLALEETFSSSAQSRIINLPNQLQTLRNEGFLITEYVSKAQIVAHHWAIINKSIPK